MATAIINDPRHSAQSADDAPRVARLAHDARLVKSMATDAVEEAMHATNHAIKSAKRQIQELADRRYEVAHRIRQEPLKAIGMAFGAGILLGAVTAVVWGTAARGRSQKP
jgi:ElaB/YqjD/DUF883 family membrane-anchored ribosome-binding protein